jgi:phosphatidate cytidylyltransferase
MRDESKESITPNEPRDADEDPFEDLDKFFAPIQDVEWPELEPPAASEAAPPAQGGTAVPSPPEDATPTESQTQELSSDELAELHARLEGDPRGGEYGFMGEYLPGDSEAASTAEAPAASAEAAAAGEQPADGPRELTLDDLRRAPPEYSELPPPSGDQEQTAEETAVSEPLEPPSGASPEQVVTVLGDEPLGWETGSVDLGPLDEEGAALRDLWDDVPPGTTAGSGGEEEPPPGGSEAAAERIAASVREDSVGGGHVDEGDLLSDLGAAPPTLGEPSQPAAPPTTEAAAPVKVGVAESLGGPSWQDPTSEEVAFGPEEPGRPPRNLPAALVSGAVLVVLGVVSVLLSKAAFSVVATIVVLLAQAELYAAIRREQHRQPATALGLVLGALVMAAAYLKHEPAVLAIAVLSVLFTFLWFMATPAKARRDVLQNIAATILPILYVPVLASFVLLLVLVSKGLMLAVVGLTVGYDIAAFAIGSVWGERPLAPNISPRKSWQGAFGAALVVLFASVAIVSNIDPIQTMAQAIGLGLIVAIMAPLGDLAESLLKRDLDIKDIGSILPGHGGALDRVDSLLFVLPAAWFFFRIVLF